MTQPSLLDLPEPRHKKAGRVPKTSVAVAQALGASGYLEHRERDVLQQLRNWHDDGLDNPTSGEMALYRSATGEATTDLKLYVRRGLSALRERGAVEHSGERVCAVTKRRCVTWRVVSR